MKKSFFLALFLAIGVAASYADTKTGLPIRVGLLASLSGFAASYGNAVRQGVELAQAELKLSGIKVELSIEDDGSESSKTLSGYKALRDLRQVDGVIGGSWWLNSIVKVAESDNKIVLSAETLLDQDTILGKSYFIMLGDLRQWIAALLPAIKSNDFKRVAMVRFNSGFGQTLEVELKRSLKEIPGKEFIGTIEYSDVELKEAASIALRLKSMHPDAVYIDSQPYGGALLLKRMAEIGLTDLTIMTHSVIDDMGAQKLAPLEKFKQIIYTDRKAFDPVFVEKFEAAFGHKPLLHADVGYLAMKALVATLTKENPLLALQSGQVEVDGKKLIFSSEQVYMGVEEEAKLWGAAARPEWNR